jgi:N-acetyl-anhydromuramyl-L-alanine amidase AmpD
LDEYHLAIDSDGAIYTGCNSLTEYREHTWHRNSGNVGIALACCVDGDTNDLGACPPTNEQIESVSQLVAVICKYANLPIIADYVMTHGEIADIDGYGLGSGDPQTRWDLKFLSNDKKNENGGDIIREKASIYLGGYYEQNF